MVFQQIFMDLGIGKILNEYVNVDGIGYGANAHHSGNAILCICTK